MDHTRKVDIPLVHHVDVTKATQYLLHQLGCEDWYVACHHEHQFIMHLSKEGIDKFAVCFDCSPPVEKGIYHGSLAWYIGIVPLHGQEDIPEDTVRRIKAGLAGLATGSHGP